MWQKIKFLTQVFTVLTCGGCTQLQYLMLEKQAEAREQALCEDTPRENSKSEDSQCQ